MMAKSLKVHNIIIQVLLYECPHNMRAQDTGKEIELPAAVKFLRLLHKLY